MTVNPFSKSLESEISTDKKLLSATKGFWSGKPVLVNATDKIVVLESGIRVADVKQLLDSKYVEFSLKTVRVALERKFMNGKARLTKRGVPLSFHAIFSDQRKHLVGMFDFRHIPELEVGEPSLDWVQSASAYVMKRAESLDGQIAILAEITSKAAVEAPGKILRWESVDANPKLTPF